MTKLKVSKKNPYSETVTEEFVFPHLLEILKGWEETAGENQQMMIAHKASKQDTRDFVEILEKHNWIRLVELETYLKRIPGKKNRKRFPVRSIITFNEKLREFLGYDQINTQIL